MKTTESNKLIAEFMGYDFIQQHSHYIVNPEGFLDNENTASYKFNKDWNWLMPVIKEIGDKTDFELVMGYGYCYWNNEGEQPLGDFEGGYSDIIYIYSAVASFIKWYNENK